jgi:hypothetical protein
MPKPSLRKRPLKASEVLTKALKFWGQGGENWIQLEIGDGVEEDGKDAGAACLVGGLTAGVTGCAVYPTELVETQTRRAVHKAMAHIWDELEARGLLDGASRRPSFATLEEDLVSYNDNKISDYDELRSVVCAAVKRALTAEEQETHA